MFGFGGAERRKRALAAMAGELPGGVAALHPVERATVLVLGNCLLRTASEISGAPFADDPAASATAADGALRDLMPLRERLAAIVADERSPNRRHATCHLRAAELACLTVGVALDEGLRRACGESWKAAWEGRARLHDAVLWIRRYERQAGVSAVPVLDGGDGPSDIDLARIGLSVPGFLRKKKAA